MAKRILICFVSALLLLVSLRETNAQTRTVGLFYNDSVNNSPGYTLFGPKMYTKTYLINNTGRLVHSWTHSTFPPGGWAYLLPNGNLLRACAIRNDTITAGGGEGGRVELWSWGDTLLWYYNYSTANYTLHHDIKMLPNGNILMLAIEKKTVAQVLAAGFDTSKFQPEFRTLGYMVPDYIIEVQPTYPSGGTIVWQWHVWDHLIQDFDPTKLNYGVVQNHPELIGCAGNGGNIPSFWNHVNSIDYNAKFDQIVISVRGNSEAWVIDHSTTTQQAAGHTGGRYGHGGDLLYRWGNPVCYKRGNASNEKLFQQHDVNWIDSACPGAGHLICFDNGVGRNYSSIDEFAPPVDSLGFYYLAPGSTSTYGPSTYSWTYTATPPNSMYAGDISGAQRLKNGNTIICVGTTGQFYEVKPNGQLVWSYVCPVTNHGPLHWYDTIPHDPTHPTQLMNMVFRVRKYAPDFPAFVGKDLTPGGFIELYSIGVKEEGGSVPAYFELRQNYPNPFNPATTIKFALPQNSFVSLKIYDMLGKEIETLLNDNENAGTYRVDWNASKYPSGIYFCKIAAGSYSKIIKMVLVK